MRFGVVRFNEMKKYIGSISYKTLSSTLKELEADKLINRREYPQIPPKVEYSLTERGKSLIPILDMMCDWGEQNRRNEKLPKMVCLLPQGLPAIQILRVNDPDS